MILLKIQNTIYWLESITCMTHIIHKKLIFRIKTTYKSIKWKQINKKIGKIYKEEINKEEIARVKKRGKVIKLHQ